MNNLNDDDDATDWVKILFAIGAIIFSLYCFIDYLLR